MTPTIGRIVIYKTLTGDRISKRGVVNNQTNEQEELPAIITAVWGDDCVNLKVILDGEGSYWVTSALKGDEEGQWKWPERK